MYRRNPWETDKEVLCAINMGREMTRSDIVRPFMSRTAVAACVRNVVASASMGCSVDTTQVWKRFPATYRPDFTSLVKRTSNPYNTALISTGGYTVVIGTNSVNATLLALHYHRFGLIEIGLRPTLRYVSIDNLVVSGSVPFKVEISNYEDDVCEVLWAPFLFPAMILRFINPTGTGLLFRGGSFMLVGMSRQQDIDIMYNHFMKILDMHSIDMFDQSAGSSEKQAELSAAQSSQGQRNMIRRRGGRKNAQNENDIKKNEDDNEIQLLPAQYKECLRRADARLNATGARGKKTIEIMTEEIEAMKNEIRAERKKKKERGEKRSSTEKNPPRRRQKTSNTATTTILSAEL